MKKAILATKIGMTQIFGENGVFIPVTVLQAGPCAVTQVKTAETDGYNAVQVGFGEIRDVLVNKPRKGHLRVSRVQSSATGFQEDRWDMVPSTTGTQVRTDRPPHRDACSRASICRVRWVM